MKSIIITIIKDGIIIMMIDKSFKDKQPIGVKESDFPPYLYTRLQHGSSLADCRTKHKQPITVKESDLEY
jgi:hypothetical protein